MRNKKPNIVLCMCDQLRSFEVGCYGNERVRTPNIDRLAENGARFDPGITVASRPPPFARPRARPL